MKKQFESINITKYKGLTDIQLKYLSNVNIITGKNNIGKTRLLEAIYLLIMQRNSMIIKECKDRAPELVDEVNITGRHNFEQIYIPQIFSEHTKPICSIRIISDNAKYEGGSYLSWFYGEKNKKLLPKLLKFLQSNLMSDLLDIKSINGFVCELITGDKTVCYLKNQGRAFRKIFNIAFLFAEAKNGIILIDGIEESLHVDLLKPFAKFIFKLSRMFKVQVFATTQSKECINAFAGNISEKNKLTAYCLSDKAKYIKGEHLVELINNMDIDIRLDK